MGIRLVSAVICSIFLSCQPQPSDGEQYLNWMANPKNGLNVIKKTSVFEMGLQLLPVEYRLNKELANSNDTSTINRDSLYQALNKSLHFIFTIAPRNDRAAGDIVYSGVSSFEDYKKRLGNLNFGFKDYWELRIGNERLSPVLSNLENTYGLADYRKVHLVFAAIENNEERQMDLVFNDEVFGSGVHHFVFDGGK